MALVFLATTGVINPSMAALAGDTSRALLVCAIAAAGVKTSFADLAKLGWQPVVMLLGETLFIAAVVLAAVLVLRLDA